MPQRPLSPCNYPGCPALVRGQSYCDKHLIAEQQTNATSTKQYDKARGNAAHRGYNSQWRKVRAVKLARAPMCERCCRAAATVVHHVQPVSSRPDLRLTYSNLQSVCNECHEAIHSGERWGRGA